MVPADTPVTSPEFETVATAVLLEVHGLVVAAVPFPVNCKFALAQTGASPEIVGSGFTVIVNVAELAHCPAVGVNVYVVVATLFKAGDHVPLTSLVDFVGKVDNAEPLQIAGTEAKDGLIGSVTVTVAVLEQLRLFR